MFLGIANLTTNLGQGNRLKSPDLQVVAKAAAPRIGFFLGWVFVDVGERDGGKNPLKFSLHLEVVVFFLGGGGSNMGNDNKTFG